MKITSPAFNAGGFIPKKYTCEGEDVSPALVFLSVPVDAKSLVLLMDDPDVPLEIRPEKMWDHWVVYNMPSTTTDLETGQTPPGILGQNTAGQNVYMGPCPPDREHRYFFKLYALDKELTLAAGATKRQVEDAMLEHVIEKAELIGRYTKVSS